MDYQKDKKKCKGGRNVASKVNWTCDWKLYDIPKEPIEELR